MRHLLRRRGPDRRRSGDRPRRRGLQLLSGKAARPTPPLRRELLAVFAILLGGALLFAVVGLLAILPFLQSPREAFTYVLILLVADLAVLLPFGNAILRSRLVTPVEGMVDDVHRIAGGAYQHRVRDMESRELDAIRESVNEMADRLIHNQELLAENVESLDRTNRELVEARDQVVQVARLASVGTLAAGIAHEVGNPLGAVIGYVDVARKRVAREGGDTEILDRIRDEAERIDRIVRGLLDYARPREVELAPVHPAAVLAGVRSLLESQGKLERVDDRWELDAPDVPEVLMESHRLEQVMVNLLLNALQAMDGVGSLRVALSGEPGGVQQLPGRREDDPPGVDYMHRRRVSRDEGGKGLDPLFTAERVAVIRIEDRGPGIPPDDLERIFDPFFTTKEPGEGTGLGLSICARLVDGMGGRIEADNLGDGGAAFTIRLPGVSAAGVGGDPPEGGEA